MANDLTLPVRRASLKALKANALLTALVPAPSIYPQTVPPTPAWPFVKMGSPTPTPVRASCVDGAAAIFAVHGFAKARINGAGGMLETAEDLASRIGSAIASALDRQRLVLDGGQSARVLWTGSQLMQDGDEADAYHAVVNFKVRVLA